MEIRDWGLGVRSQHIAALLFLLALTGCGAEVAPTLAAAASPPLPYSLTPLHTPSHTPHYYTLKGTCTLQGTPLHTPSPTPTLTPQPTNTATPSPTPTEPPTVRQLRVFDQLYNLVLNNYLYPDYNGLNWPAWGAVYRERVAAGMTDDEFYRAMAELVGKLNDGHSAFHSPAAADVTDAAIQGQRQVVGIGVETAPRPERGTAVLLVVYPDGPAWKAGLRPHDSLLALDGQPILERLAQLQGPAGSSVTLTVQTPGQPLRQVTIVRALVASSPPLTARRWEEGEVIYVAIRTLWDRNTAPLLRRRLQELGDEGPIGGIVIDLRVNRGGSEYSLEGVLGLFADGTLGYFTRRSGERPLAVAGVEAHNSQTVPLVILVGRETSSYAEILAGALQNIGRARLVGTVTGGNVETIWPHDFEDGSRVWIAEEGFRPLDGRNWERDGIVPDVYVAGDWADFTAETDTQLETADELCSDGGRLQ